MVDGQAMLPQLYTTQNVPVPSAQEAYRLSGPIWMGKENFEATAI